MERIRELTGQSLIYMVSFGLSRGLPVLLLPLYLAYLSPTIFGYLALSEVVASLAKVIFSQGLDASVFHHFFTFRDAKTRQRYLGSVWMYLFVAGIILMPVTLVGAGYLHQRINLNVPFHPYISLALVTAFVRSSFELVVLQILRAQEDALKYAQISLVSVVATAGAQIYFLIFRGLGGEGIVIGSLVGAIVVAVFCVPFLARSLKIAFDLSHIRRGLEYGIPLVPHLLGHWLSNLSDRIVLERFVPISQVGIYSVADRFRQGYAIIPWGLNSAIISSFSKARVEARARERLPRLVTYYCLFLAASAIVLITLAPVIIRLIAPDSYAGLQAIVPWLVLGGLIYGTYFVPMNFLAQTVGETKEVSLATIFSGVLNVTLNLVLVPRYGIAAAAVNTSISSLTLLILMYILASRHEPLALEFVRLGKIATAVVLSLATGAILDEMMNVGFFAAVALPFVFISVLILSDFITKQERDVLLRSLQLKQSR